MSTARCFSTTENSAGGGKAMDAAGLSRSVYQTGDNYPSGAPMINGNGILFFAGNDGVNGKELWKATVRKRHVMVADINPGSAGSSPAHLSMSTARSISANDGVDGTELWQRTAHRWSWTFTRAAPALRRKPANSNARFISAPMTGLTGSSRGSSSPDQSLFLDRAPSSTTAGGTLILRSRPGCIRKHQQYYTGPVHSQQRWACVLPANYTYTAPTRACTPSVSRSRRRTAVDHGHGYIDRSMTGRAVVTVAPAAASTLKVTGFPSPTTAAPPQLHSNRVRSVWQHCHRYTARAFHERRCQAVLPANYTFTSSDAGRHTFSATLKTAGTQSSGAADTVSSPWPAPRRASRQPDGRQRAAHHGPLPTSRPALPSASRSRPMTRTATWPPDTLDGPFQSTDKAGKLPTNYTFAATIGERTHHRRRAEIESKQPSPPSYPFQLHHRQSRRQRELERLRAVLIRFE